MLQSSGFPQSVITYYGMVFFEIFCLKADCKQNKKPAIRFFQRITGFSMNQPVSSLAVRLFRVVHPFLQKVFEFVNEWHLVKTDAHFVKVAREMGKVGVEDILKTVGYLIERNLSVIETACRIQSIEQFD
jgi:hypothetical protein